MQYFLAKIDPETYSIEDLAKEKETVWNGVRNPQALQAIKAMKPGDLVLIYHSGGKPAIVGLMKVKSDPRPDVKIEKSWVVDVEYLKTFEQPVSLKEIKETGLFDDWKLVYQGRLSTMTVPEKFIRWLKEEKGLKV